jgi:hypothetical protein
MEHKKLLNHRNALVQINADRKIKDGKPHHKSIEFAIKFFDCILDEEIFLTLNKKHNGKQ